MKTRHYISIIMLMLLNLLTASAQTNTLTIPDVTVAAGKTISLPVNMDNTADIVAVQFTLTLSDGITIQPSSATLSERADGHAVTIRPVGDNKYMAMVYSSANKAIKGRTGKLMSVNLTASSALVEGTELQLALSDVVIGAINGDNLATGFSAGKVTIAKSADLEVSGVTTTASAANPGDKLSVSWQVSNIGGLSTDAGWNEQIYLDGENGASKLLATTYYDSALNEGGVVSRSAEINLPQILGVAGNATIRIKLTPDSKAGEPSWLRDNNTASCPTAISIGRKLLLSPEKANVEEASNPNVRFYLQRSGSTIADETFTLAATADSRITLPENITISKGLSGVYFYAQVKANGAIDDNDVVAIAISGNGYEEVGATLNIENDTYPSLTLVSQAQDVEEGKTITFTITAQRAPKEDLEIKLTNDFSSRFNIPSIVLPAGQTSVDVTVEAKQDDVPDVEQVVTFTASAAGYNSASLNTVLVDDDVPTLQLSLTPDAVSEAAGPLAVVAKLRRTDNINKVVTVKFSDDSNGGIYYGRQSVEMAAGVEEVTVNLGPVDNAIVDGERTYNISAAVWISSCSCSATGTQGGVVSVPLTVYDNDGPTLTLSSSSTVLKEGDEITLSVSRNTETTEALTVNLTSDHDSALGYPSTVVIPAGENAVSFTVKSVGNDTNDDSFTAVITASSGDYAKSNIWFAVSDQTLPDAQISAIEISASEVMPNETVIATVTIANAGSYVLPKQTKVAFYLGNSKKAVATAILPSALNVGESATVSQEITMPNTIGTYNVYAKVNEDEEIKELSLGNNMSQLVPVKTVSPFKATVQTDKAIYQQGETVVVTGQLQGKDVANKDVEIYFINNYDRRTISVTASADGSFIAEYTPIAGQMGHFTVGACFASEKLSEEMASFDIYGLKTSAWSKCELAVTETHNGTITVSNPGNIAQTNIKVSALAESENCEFTFSSIDKLEAGASATIEYTVKGNDVSATQSEWQVLPIKITSDEGSVANHKFYYYVQSLHGKLYASQSAINTTISLSASRDYPITVRNIGKGETGQISLSLPACVTSATPQRIPSLASGDSTTVILRFNPTSDMKLNVPVNGSIGINCDNGDGTMVKFSLTPVSEVKGTLKLDVVDEFTFYTEEAPHVSGAKVTIKRPVTNEVVASGVTGSNGIYQIELEEGWYSISVEAEKHDSYTNSIVVDPGVIKEQEIFMPYQAVTYSWDVVETEIEDEYEMETLVKFDTRVPKPIIVMTLPDKKPEPNEIIPVYLTNKGLINAVDLELSLETSEGYSFEFLSDPTAETIAPQQTLVFYARLIPDATSANAKAKTPRSSTKCFYIISKAKYHELCEKYKGAEFVRQLRRYGTKQCVTSVIGGGYDGGYGGGYVGGYGPGGYSPGGIGSPSVWNGNSYGSENYVIDWSNPAKFCNKKNGNVGDDDDDDFGDGGDDNDDPIDLPKVGDEDPDEIDCSEIPVLCFKLIPVTGERYEMKGVAADGVSQVKIVLDPEKSKIPQKDCGNFSNFRWELNRDCGSIESISDWEAIYTAPEDYPDNHGISTSVKATLVYSHRTSENTTWGRTAEPVEIEIIRPPLILIHGLNDKGYNPKKPDGFDGCWSSLYHILKGIYYEDYNIVRMDYSASHSSAFETNLSLVNQEIKRIRRNTKANGYISTKCDLVGHSMGGILSRQHVQHYGDKYVNKLITVNTPHSGSEFGDAVHAHKIVIGNLARLLTWDTDIDAIYDLAVESDAIKNLNAYAGAKYDVAVHSVATETNLLLPALLATGKYAAGEIGSKLITKWPWGTLIGILLKYSAHFVDDVSQVGAGDMVVSTESQIGGCDATTTIYSGPWHSNSPSNEKTMTAVMNLLKSGKKTADFSYNWFKPAMRFFDHSKWWALQEAAQTVPDILLDKGFELKFKEVKDLEKETEKWKIIEGIVNGLKNGAQISKEIYEFSVNYSPNRAKSRSNEVEEKGCYCNVIKLAIPENEYLSDFSAIFTFDDGNEEFVDGSDEIKCIVPSTYSGNVKIRLMAKYGEDTIVYDNFEITIATPVTSPSEIDAHDVILEKGETVPMRVTCIWEDESETEVAPETVVFDNPTIAKYENGMITGLAKGMTVANITYKGMTNTCIVRVFASSNKQEDDDSEAICSTITLSFKQNMAMTRQAFRGTLTLNNGYKTDELKDFKLNLEVRNDKGELMGRNMFEITPDSLAGFVGEKDFNAGWSLAPDASGVATVLFIPTKYAAPTESKDYSFGGSFSYTDPSTGTTVTRDLNPITLTVNPSPNLDLTFFMQRDVIGDDPLTEEIEPCEEAEFSLLINNKGYGDAKNLRMKTKLPEIIENEKGIITTFDLMSSQLNGGEKSLVLGGDVGTEFGTIEAQKTAYAQWWFKSSLLGHFKEYDVKATHVTSHDNPDLSLLDSVSIHELIRSIDIIDGESKMVGFMTNDIPDANDTPDMLYLSNGEIEEVAEASTANIVKTSDTDYALTIMPSRLGWNYGNIVDPTYGVATLRSVVRQSDGKEISLRNFWLTDRTLRDGKDPLYENRIHFADNFSVPEAETYVLTFDPVPELLLEVVSIENTPAEGTIATVPVDSISVMFNKAVDPMTFTSEDITLAVQGVKQNVESVKITTKDNKTFALDLTDVNRKCGNGYYVLTVQTANITDTDGFNGKTGKSVSWNMFQDGLVRVNTTVTPEEAGVVNDIFNAFYGDTITLAATANRGYEFAYWTVDGNKGTSNTELECVVTDDTDIIANFIKKSYSVTIESDNEGGVISGAYTGIYPFGQELTLSVAPNDDYLFAGWMVNDELIGKDESLTVTVDSVMSISAKFVNNKKYNQVIEFSKGWNWVSGYLKDALPVDALLDATNRIVGQFDETIKDPDLGFVGGIESLELGKAYKIEATSDFSATFTNYLYDLNESPIVLKRGWNWIAYPYNESRSIESVVTNAEDGDYITSQYGFTEYADGNWEGSINQFNAGYGYLYKSASDKELVFDFETGAQKIKAMSKVTPIYNTEISVDVHKYPNTMNVTAKLYSGESEITEGEYYIYAMSGNELRGVSKYMNGKYYITVYGDSQSEVSFFVENVNTKDSYFAKETLRFTNDIVGSRKAPFVMTIGDATGIGSLIVEGKNIVVYSVEGLLISNNATMDDIKKLAKGVYVINGRKYLVK